MPVSRRSSAPEARLAADDQDCRWKLVHVPGLCLPGVLQVIGPNRVECGSCGSTDSTRRPIPPRILWCCLFRLGSATDAFLLKIIVEERLGYPVQLISDGLVRSIESSLNLTGPASVYAALAAGTADIYPEVRRVACVHACVLCMQAYDIAAICAVWNGSEGLKPTLYEVDQLVSQASSCLRSGFPRRWNNSRRR